MKSAKVTNNRSKLKEIDIAIQRQIFEFKFERFDKKAAGKLNVPTNFQTKSLHTLSTVFHFINIFSTNRKQKLFELPSVISFKRYFFF